MGYNTGIIVLNDALGTIKDHPQEFVENLEQAIGTFGYSDDRKDIRCGNHCNAASVFHVSHADNWGVYTIGGNYASSLMPTFRAGNRGHHKPEDKEALLKMLADELGYSVIKKG